METMMACGLVRQTEEKNEMKMQPDGNDAFTSFRRLTRG